MTEETNCYECDTPLVSVCPQCNALSAAPSFPEGPATDEEEMVEKIAKAMLLESLKLHPTMQNIDEIWNDEREAWLASARAALAAMRGKV